MKKLEVTDDDLESFNIRHVDSKDGKPMDIDGTPELLVVLNRKFDAWYKKNIENAPTVCASCDHGNKVCELAGWYEGNKTEETTHTAKLVNVQEIEK